MTSARFVLRVLLLLAPLAIVLASMSVNADVLNHGGGRRFGGSVLGAALLCMYGSEFLASRALVGPGLAQSANTPAAAFKVLGWILLLASFVPALIS